MEGLRDKFQRPANVSLDQASDRRRVRDAYKEIQLSIDHCLFKIPCSGLKIQESYEVNSRGVKVFTKSWLPEASPIKALVCFCHGYGDTCTFFFEGTARKLASSGFGVFAMDYPGFGLSDGLHGFISSFDALVDDVSEHYSKLNENPKFRGLPKFLFGQSMGGAISLKLHLKHPQEWDGAVLLAPMCKISDDIIPHWLVVQFLIGMSKFLPRGKLVPQKNLADLAFRDPEKRKLACFNVISYKGKPRLRTAVEMLKATQELGSHLEEISLPLLIMHGEADAVTDPSVSKALFVKAQSSDKKLRLYEGACHALLEGESDETIHSVLDDIILWLDEHSCTK